jgi:hypothetical protein
MFFLPATEGAGDIDRNFQRFVRRKRMNILLKWGPIRVIRGKRYLTCLVYYIEVIMKEVLTIKYSQWN